MKKSNQYPLAFLVSFSLMAVSPLFISKVYSQEDMLDQAESMLDSNSLQMDEIDLEGKLSLSEKLKKRREKLEERNKDMVDKKIEDIRVKQEIELTNKLQDAFSKSMGGLNEDNVTVKAAAPVAVVETKAPEIKLPEVKKYKVIPYIGAANLKGSAVDFEYKNWIGVLLEMPVMPKLNINFGVSYATLEITDVANSFYGTSFQQLPNYATSFPMGRKMSHDKLSFDLNGKFFFLDEAKIKPYVSAGVNYNRSSLKYEESSLANNFQTGQSFSLGNEGYSSTSLGGIFRLGTEFDFNETVGANLDLSYAKTLSSGVTTNSFATTLNPDQGKLEKVAKALEESDITSIQLGLLIKF